MRIFILILVSGLVLSACFLTMGESGDDAEVAITIGGGGRAAVSAWPPTEANGMLASLEHQITFRGRGETITRTLGKGSLSGRFQVPAGRYDVTVEALSDGLLFGTGAASLDAKAGASNALSVAMQQTDTVFLLASTAADWTDAVNAIKNGGNNKKYVITLTGNFDVAGNTSTTPTFGQVGNINVLIRGNHTMSMSLNPGQLLSIGPNQAVVLQDIDLNLKPKDVASFTNTTSAVHIKEGALNMQGSASVYGNNYSGNGGGVYVEGGTFTMKDNSSVHDNQGSSGGGVYVNGGTFIMQDNASVHDNNTGSNGGGVYVEGDSTATPTLNAIFIMKGRAEVYGNFSNGSGGGVFVGSVSSFRLAGGTVYGDTGNKKNEATNGASLYVGPGGTATYGGVDGATNSFFSNPPNGKIENTITHMGIQGTHW